MKKNLNIAYLNGAEGMIRRGAASSSGSGGDSGSSGGIEYTYLDLRGFDIGSNYDFLNIIPFASIVNYKGALMGRDVHWIMTYGYIALAEGDMTKNLALAIDESAIVTNIESGQLCSIKEAIEMTTAKDLYNSLPRITKEEFYSLE